MGPFSAMARRKANGLLELVEDPTPPGYCVAGIEMAGVGVEPHPVTVDGRPHARFRWLDTVLIVPAGTDSPVADETMTHDVPLGAAGTATVQFVPAFIPPDFVAPDDLLGA